MLDNTWKLPKEQRKRTSSSYVNALQKRMTLKRMLTRLNFCIANSKDMILFCSARMRPTEYYHQRLAFHIENKERIETNGFTVADITRYFG